MAKKLSEGRKPGSGTNPKSHERIKEIGKEMGKKYGPSKPTERLVKRWDDAMIGIPEPGAQLSIEEAAEIINSIPEEKKMQSSSVCPSARRRK